VKRTIADKRVILTGASSGIGWHLALQLAQQGAHVIANARRTKRLDELVETFKTNQNANASTKPGTIVPVTGDVCDRELQQQLIDTCDQQFGGAELTRLALPKLKLGNDALIVNMSSILAHRAAPLKSEYCASKFALHGFSDSIRAELATDNVSLLLVSPSTTDSEFFDSAIEDPIEDQTGKNWKKRGSMPPDVVAAKTIRAIRKRKHEIILTHGGRFLVWLDRLVPGIANRIMATSPKRLA